MYDIISYKQSQVSRHRLCLYFLTVTRITCAPDTLHLECPLDTLLDVYNISAGNLDVEMCPKESGSACDQHDTLDVHDTCQNKTMCDIYVPKPPPTLILTACKVMSMRLTYLCYSKYCIKINKSFQLVIIIMCCCCFLA